MYMIPGSKANDKMTARLILRQAEGNGLSKDVIKKILKCDFFLTNNVELRE